MKKKKTCKRARRLDISTTLSKDDTKAIAMMALHETLIIDHLSFATLEHGKVLKGMMNLLNQLNKLYAGNVEPHLIEYADRYLCRVQIAMDGFFDELTEHDRAEMEAIKADWKVGMTETVPCDK